MKQNIEIFCEMIRNRSEENRRAINSFHDPCQVLSPAFSILRQELDSMIRIIYLLQIRDLNDRERLIKSTLDGKKWTIVSHNGKMKQVLDKDLVEIAQKLQGWSQSVYQFGCSFIHLSDFHNHFSRDPFRSLPENDKMNILKHMRHYHGGPPSDDPSLNEIAKYVPHVFDKISKNLECYIKDLLKSVTE